MVVQQVVLGFFMLRRIFRSNLPVWNLVCSLHFPVLIGLGVALGFWVLDVEKLVTNWAWLIAGYAGIAAICGGAILLVNLLLPNGHQHFADLRRIVSWGKNLITTKRTIVPCAA